MAEVPVLNAGELVLAEIVANFSAPVLVVFRESRGQTAEVVSLRRDGRTLYATMDLGVDAADLLEGFRGFSPRVKQRGGSWVLAGGEFSNAMKHPEDSHFTLAATAAAVGGRKMELKLTAIEPGSPSRFHRA